jgi:hypothetical protein
MIDLRSVAGCLTAEQRQALLALPSAWGVAINFDDAECPDKQVMRSLDRLGLAYASKGEGYLATRLGLDVRGVLDDAR